MTYDFSLLAPGGRGSTEPMDETALTDLNLDVLINEMVGDKKQRDIIEGYATRLCLEGEAVEYRLDIVDDILANRGIIPCLEDLASHGIRLKYYMGHPGKTDALPLQETVWRLRELEEYLYCMEALHGTLSGLSLKSEGLNRLRDFIARCRSGEEYGELKEKLPPFLTRINKIKSLTIAVNLNEGLIPFEAALLDVSPRHYDSAPFFGKMAAGPGGKSSLGPLHTTRDTAFHSDPLMTRLFKDLSDVMGKSVGPLRNRLRKYGKAESMKLIKLLEEFVFYRGAVKLIGSLREKGYPMVRPVICPRGGHYRKIRGLYNPELALRGDEERVVANDFQSSRDDSCFLVTGPNNGGKTTFLRALGIAQYLTQLGLYVPAEKAVMGIGSAIHTHFPKLETRSGGMGRFAEEADRLKRLITRLKPDGLVLLNETLSSTNMEEAAYIARDILKVLADRRGLTVFVTHLNSLARPPAKGEEAYRSGIKCLVAQIDREGDGAPRPNYRIVPAMPDGRSYALEMARKYGLAPDQLLPREGLRYASDNPTG